MRQAALIYLYVTARLQLINCFKHRPLHELNFNTQLKLPSFLQSNTTQYSGLFTNAMFTRNSNASTKAMIGSILILMPFTKEAASLHAKPEKHKLHFSAASSLTSETCYFDALTCNYTSVHIQVFEIL